MTALSGRNQHSKRQADEHATEQREAWKDRIQSGKLSANAHMDGKVELSASQIKPAEVVLDRLVPRLSSIEQTEVNEIDAPSREDI